MRIPERIFWDSLGFFGIPVRFLKHLWDSETYCGRFFGILSESAGKRQNYCQDAMGFFEDSLQRMLLDSYLNHEPEFNGIPADSILSRFSGILGDSRPNPARNEG